MIVPSTCTSLELSILLVTNSKGSVEYWKEEKERLDKLSQQILQHNPAVRVPFVFAYWPKTESLRKAVDLVGYIFVSMKSGYAHDIRFRYLDF